MSNCVEQETGHSLNILAVVQNKNKRQKQTQTNNYDNKAPTNILFN